MHYQHPSNSHNKHAMLKKAMIMEIVAWWFFSQYWKYFCYYMELMNIFQFWKIEELKKLRVQINNASSVTSCLILMSPINSITQFAIVVILSPNNTDLTNDAYV